MRTSTIDQKNFEYLILLLLKYLKTFFKYFYNNYVSYFEDQLTTMTLFDLNFLELKIIY